MSVGLTEGEAAWTLVMTPESGVDGGGRGELIEVFSAVRKRIARSGERISARISRCFDASAGVLNGVTSFEATKDFQARTYSLVYIALNWAPVSELWAPLASSSEAPALPRTH